MVRFHPFILLILPFFLFVTASFSQGNAGFTGKWEMIPHKSSDIDLYGTLSVEIRQSGKLVTVINTWGKGRSFKDSIGLATDGSTTRVGIHSRVFPSNVFMGLMMPVGTERLFKASWENGGALLRIDEQYSIRGSQGVAGANAVHTYLLSLDGETITYTIERSTRKTGPPVHYVLKREGTASASMMRIEDNWEIDGKLPVNAFLISLQGLANEGAPRLYFVYPDKWDFLYTPTVLDYYKEKRNYTFVELRSPEAALKTFKAQVKGYVVWDKSVRTSLMVAYTVAGLEKAVVVSEELIPMAEKEGLKPLADFRGKFAGMKDIEIFTWAYNQYWKRCSKDYVVWLGGEEPAP